MTALSPIDKAFARVRDKKNVTEWFAAVLAGDVLNVRRGCVRKVVTIATGEETVTREPHRYLIANLGDRLILCGPTIEETQSATVVRIVDEKQMRIVLGYGGPIKGADVWVRRGGRAAVERKRRAA